MNSENVSEPPETSKPKIWIDADACPGAIKEIIFRTSKRLEIEVVLVANQSMQVPDSKLISAVTVRDGADIADNAIVEKMASGDVVITGDIPLAARVVEKGGIAIGTRGELFDEASVKGRLASRNLMEQLRAAGMETKGPSPLNQKDVQAFANQLDRLMTKLMKNQASYMMEK
jgi:uncharacterized protein YaiI (UPF0178 family)